MLLTRKTDSAARTAGSSAFVDRLQRGLSQALPTVDRRGFLRRSGLGVGVGLAFQVSNSVGFAVAIAVISHAVTDGLNTVMLLIRSGRWRTKAIALLALDGVARLLGATIGTYLTLSEPLLGIYLALFAGFLVYLSTSHVLPEAHSNHPSRWTLLATLLGVVVMFGIVSVGESA